VISVESLSWGAVVAGVVLALMIQLALNLSGISLGFSGINPRDDADLGGELKSFTTGAAVWMGVSTLVALFAGGWVAAHFAGSPDQMNGLLHGLLVWAVVILISFLLLLTSLGRMVSGISNLVGQTLNLAGRTVQATARGAANVTGSAVRGAANAAQSAAQQVGGFTQTVADQAGNVVQTVADHAGDVVQSTADQLDDTKRHFVQSVTGSNDGNMPNISFDQIMAEARRVLAEMGLPLEHVQQQFQAAKGDVQQAAQQAINNPQDAEMALTDALEKVLSRGRAVANDVDREDVIRILTTRTRLSESQAREVLRRWEDRAQQMRAQASVTVQQAQQQVAQVQDQIQNKVQEVRDQVSDQVEELRYNAEHAARETAQHTTEAIARIAGAVFVLIIIGGFAAGIGGWFGAPQTIPNPNAVPAVLK